MRLAQADIESGEAGKRSSCPRCSLKPWAELRTEIKLTVLQFHYPTHTSICFSLQTISLPLSGPHAHSQPFILLLQLIAKCCSALCCLKTGLPEDVPQLQEPSRVSFYTLALHLYFSYSFQNTFLRCHASLHLLPAFSEQNEFRWESPPSAHP